MVKFFAIVSSSIILVYISLNLFIMAEEHDYKVLKVIDDVEIRSYDKMIYASYTPQNERDRNSSFKMIANYIFGGNANNEQIPMTSPVVMKPYDNYQMAFIMPDNYTLKSLPKPNNSQIKISQIPSSIKAVISYSGYSNSKIENKKKEELIAVLTAHNISHENDFEVLVYNSPYKVFNRRNEVVVSVNFNNKANYMSHKNEKLYLGGGCFWCVEAVFQDVIGVKKVVSGYSGGLIKNPTYEQVSSGRTKHAEVCEITYNPADIELEQLLKIFFASHDPTTINKQGNDVGEHYRSIVFFSDLDQKKVIDKTINDLNEAVFDHKIVTQVQSFNEFYMAETYHQDYYENNKYAPYCSYVISPKVDKLKKELSQFYK
ncbi:MAG: peptide-methionine (S)-S-oxide reductase [Bacteroidetes bacterium MED-G21]|nr:MAG: peptide-methionine (S)-S-oxide reductase [Bacteroidetes bacterium MED-G21]